MKSGGKAALVAFVMDAADALDAAADGCDSSARDSSLARGYDALGVELHALDQDDVRHAAEQSHTSRSGSCARHSSRSSCSGQSKTSKSDRSSRGCGEGSASTRALSAMEMDLGNVPTPGRGPASFSGSIAGLHGSRSASTGTLRVSKFGQVGLLPAVPSKVSGLLPAIAQSRHAALAEPFAWGVGSMGGARARRAGLGSVF